MCILSQNILSNEKKSILIHAVGLKKVNGN